METHPKYKILIVDDDTFLLNMYSMKFTKEGMDVTALQNSAEALQKLKDGYAPEILVLDVIMPGLDGLQLLGEIRKNNLVPKATVVMLTNQSDTADIERAKSLHANGYIVKATTIPSEVVSDILTIHNEKKYL